MIFPVHLRILASEAERVKLLTDEENGGEKYNKDNTEDIRNENETLGMIAKNSRLGVIVDRMEHLQGLMDLLSCFIPFTSDSKLAVTGDRFIQFFYSFESTYQKNILLYYSFVVLLRILQLSTCFTSMLY